jgi:4-hydroxyphenylpyruvate dioxygenase
MSTIETLKDRAKLAQDFLPMLGTDYVEIYCGNAKQSAHYYKSAFGYQDFAYKGLETGSRDATSYVLRQGKVTLVLTSPMNSQSPINDHLKKHGDGVKVYAITVEDATKAYQEATNRGGIAYMEPTTQTDDNGTIVMSGIRTYGDTINMFIERKNYSPEHFMPGFSKLDTGYHPSDVGLLHVDHAVGNVELGDMNKWVEYYEKVMGFYNLVTFDDNDISTEYTSLMSKVVSNGNGYIKFPINEPAKGKKKSQIEEYLDWYEGAGVQHVAIATNDIVHTVGELRKRGVQFLLVPDTYYDDLLDRVGNIDEDIAILRDLNILVDRDEEGYLLQIFTKPVQDRPTLFYEIIQRKGALSFGKGNFKALFEAIEREQELRGNL